MNQTSEVKHRRQTPLVPCEGFVGVYSRAGAGNGATRYHVRLSLPGGGAVYVGSFPDTGKAALEHDNVVRHFLANKPEGFKYSPGFNYPLSEGSEAPLPGKRAIELLPKFIAAVNKRVATVKPKEARARNFKLGRPNLRPMVEFNLLTLRDVRLRLSQFQFTPDIADTLRNFSAALQGLLAYHKVDVSKRTPENPDAVEFQKKIDALVHEANVQRGLAELQRDLPGVEGAIGGIGCDGVQCVPAVPTFGDIKCPGDLT